MTYREPTPAPPEREPEREKEKVGATAPLIVWDGQGRAAAIVGMVRDGADPALLDQIPRELLEQIGA
jgi:hypothetical protein